MTLYTDRSKAHVTVAADCAVSFSASSKGKGAGLWKRRATEVHLIAAQKFLSLDYLHEMWQNHMQLTVANILKDF